ncbi:hypothetical protein GKO28_03805 [Deefgea sp. CFH1-16]|nr:hypothetical protein [Deefgea sp. CFH1-16]
MHVRRSVIAYSNGLAKILRLPLLCAVHAPGGAASQRIEIERLAALHRAGVPVPQVRHIEQDWFAMSVAGEQSLEELLRTSGPEQLEIWLAGLQAILQVHQCHQNLSQAFTRNIMWQNGQIQFIDFEDDPAKSLPLAYAQSRDWLLYLQSSAYYLQADNTTLAQRLLQQLMRDDPEVRELVLHSARQLAFLRHLPKNRRPWGRDVVLLQRAAQVLHALNQAGAQLSTRNTA